MVKKVFVVSLSLILGSSFIIGCGGSTESQTFCETLQSGLELENGSALSYSFGSLTESSGESVDPQKQLDQFIEESKELQKNYKELEKNAPTPEVKEAVATMSGYYDSFIDVIESTDKGNPEEAFGKIFEAMFEVLAGDAQGLQDASTTLETYASEECGLETTDSNDDSPSNNNSSEIISDLDMDSNENNFDSEFENNPNLNNLPPDPFGGK